MVLKRTKIDLAELQFFVLHAYGYREKRKSQTQVVLDSFELTLVVLDGLEWLGQYRQCALGLRGQLSRQ